MSFYDDASLVVIPSAQKTSKLYAVKPTDGSGDLAFTRTGDTATRVNSAGLIEKVRTNLVLQSEALNTTWVPSRGAVTANATTAPNGTTTADKFVPDTQVNPHFVNQAISGLTSGGIYTCSVYAKVAEWNSLAIFRGDSAIGVNFRLDTQAMTVLAGSPVTYSITDAGNGWYRCSMSFAIASTSDGAQFRVGNNSNYSIAGNNANGLFLWGAQYEATDFGATPYIATTTAAVSVGPVANVPRLDYLGSTCPRLILEPQRQNVCLWSEQINNAAWVKSAGGTGTSPAVTANNATSPDGYQNADKVVFNSGAGTTSADQSMLEPNAFSVTNGTTYTGSFWARGAVGGEQLAFRHVGAFTKVTLTTSWQRYTLTTTAAYTGTGYFTVGIRRGLVEPLNSSATVYIWGAQLEAGAYATSYIPTLAASATRGADFYEKAGFGNTSTAGTLYYEFQNYQSPASANGLYMVCLFAGSAVTSTAYSPAESISIINNGVTVQGRNDGLATTLFSITPALNATVKVALRYDGTNVVAFVNGVKGTVFSDTAVGAKNAIRVNNGENATHATKQLLFFPSALTDAQLIELTTL